MRLHKFRCLCKSLVSLWSVFLNRRNLGNELSRLHATCQRRGQIRKFWEKFSIKTFVNWTDPKKTGMNIFKSISLLCLVYFSSSLALYFHISETERKCFIEELPDQTMVIGELISFLDVIICQVAFTATPNPKMEFNESKIFTLLF